MEGGDTLTIRQAATLLNCHPNTVRNRIKSGTYRAEKVITEHGETYLIQRSELVGETSANSVPSSSHSQPLPNVREAMQAMLEPFVRELGDVREELGRERERREQLEEERDQLRRELAALREAREAPEMVEEGPEGAKPRSTTGGAQEAAQRPQGGGLRGLRQRILGW
jgi:excisionase family DNA binding protein